MGIPSQQIGWSQKSKLLWNISKQLEKLTQVAGNVEVGPVGPTTTTTSTSSTTTTTTTVAPGPVASYTGTIGVNTVTPGNELFKFSISARNLESTMNVSVNWGDNTSESYTVGSGSAIYPTHTYATNGLFTATITIDDPSLINTIIIDRLSAESTAIPTGFNFSDFNGLASIIASNTLLHTADTAGLTTLNSLTINNADLESLALVNASSLQTLSAQNNNLSVLDLTSATVLSYADLHNNELVGLDIDNATALTYLNLDDNALVQANVDAILLALVANNQTNGTVSLTGVANDAPSSTGLSAKATLEARGWTVNVSTSSSINTKLMYYMFGYSYNAKNTMFINDYYINNNVNTYRQWQVQNRPPKTVYYIGAFGPNTTLYTNPELTEFVVQQQNNWGYWMGVFVDATLPESGSNISIPGDIIIYSFNQYTGVILNNLGTIANSTWTYQSIVKADNASTYCDNNQQWPSNYGWYPPGQNGLVVGGYVFGSVDSYSGNGGDIYQVAPVVREGYDGTTVYAVNTNNGLITATNACTYVPTWNAAWGATAQEAIDGINPIAIKPKNGTSMLSCNNIKKADGTIFNGLPGLFYIAYDGVVRLFYNYGSEAYWNEQYPLQPITPPVTPYSYQVLQTSCCSCFFDPNYESQKFTVYSNFATAGYGTPIYTDVELTTPLQQYTYYTNGSSYFNFFDYQWVYINNPCL